MIVTESGYELQAKPPDGGTYRFEYDRATTPASMAAISTLSEVTGRPPTDLDPIEATLATDALDALLRPRAGRDGDVQVIWTQEAHTVSIHSGGVVEVTPAYPDRGSPQ